MIRRTTIITVLVFVSLLVAVFYWQRKSPGESSETTPTATQETLLEPDLTIVRLRIDGVEGTVEVAKGEDGIWELVQPEAEETDVGAVEAAVTQLLALRILNRLEQIPDLEDLGLVIPSYRITLTLDDGSQIIADVGSVTPTESGYYVLASDRPLSVVPKSGLDSFLNLVKNPPIQPTVTPTSEPDPTQATPAP